MAGKPIQIEFISNIKDVLNKNHGLELSFEDVADAIAETGKDSKKSMRQVLDGLEDVQKEARRAEDDIEDMSRGASKSFRKTGDAAQRAGRDMDDGIRGSKLGEAGSEVGEELVQNLGEAVSSGDASGLVAGSLGGLLGSMPAKVAGPAGLAAGAAAALAVAWWQSFKDKNQQLGDEVAEAIADVLNGATDVNLAAPKAAVEDLYQDLAGEGEDASKGQEKLVTLADQIGVSVASIGEAAATNNGEFAKQVRVLESARREAQQLEGQVGMVGRTEAQRAADRARLAELNAQLEGVNRDLLKETAEALERNNKAKEIGVELNKQDLAIQGAALEATGDAVEGTGELVAEKQAYKDLLEEIPEDQRKNNRRAQELRELIKEINEKIREQKRLNDEAWKNRTMNVKVQYVDRYGNPTQDDQGFYSVDPNGNPFS